jgi:hypothetical protein
VEASAVSSDCRSARLARSGLERERWERETSRWACGRLLVLRCGGDWLRCWAADEAAPSGPPGGVLKDRAGLANPPQPQGSAMPAAAAKGDTELHGDCGCAARETAIIVNEPPLCSWSVACSGSCCWGCCGGARCRLG